MTHNYRSLALIALIVGIGCQEPLQAELRTINPLDSVKAQLLLIPIQGNNQTGVVSGQLGDSLIVRALTLSGYPMPGVLVRWLSNDDGSDLTAYVRTDDNGHARSGWRLGKRAGPQLAWAIVDGFSHATYFNATATDSVRGAASVHR
jgi:hypothetical protein